MVLLDADTRDPADPPTPLEALLLKERSFLFPAEVVLAGCLFPRQCDNCGGYDQYEAGDLIEPAGHLRVIIATNTARGQRPKSGCWRGPLTFKATCLEGCFACRGCRAGTPPPLCDWCAHKFPGSSVCSTEAHDVANGPSAEEEGVDVSLRAACPMHMCIGRSVKATQPLEVAYSLLEVRSPCGRHHHPVKLPTHVPGAVAAITRCMPTCTPEWSRLVTHDTGTTQPSADLQHLMRDIRADLENAALHVHTRVAQRLLDGSLVLDSLTQEQQAQLKEYAAFVVAELQRYDMLIAEDEQQQLQQTEDFLNDAALDLLQLAATAAPAATAATVTNGRTHKRKRHTPRRCTSTVPSVAGQEPLEAEQGRQTRRKAAATHERTPTHSHCSEDMRHSISSDHIQQGQQPHGMGQGQAGVPNTQALPIAPANAAAGQHKVPSVGIRPSLPALPDTTNVVEAAGPLLELMVALEMSDREQLEACNRLEAMQRTEEGTCFMGMAYRAMRLQVQHDQRSALALFVRAKLLA